MRGRCWGAGPTKLGGDCAGVDSVEGLEALIVPPDSLG